LTGFLCHYKAEGLRSMARLIEGKDPVTITIDKSRRVHIPIEMNEQLKQELNLIADELEHYSEI
jgi:hypothetical protein